MANKAFVTTFGFTANFPAAGDVAMVFSSAIVRPDNTVVYPPADEAAGGSGGLQGYGQIRFDSTLASLREAQENYITANWTSFGLSPGDLPGLQFVYLDDKGLL